MKGRGAGTADGEGPKLEKPVDCCWKGKLGLAAAAAEGGGEAKASKPENELLLLLVPPPPPPPPPPPEGVPKASNEAPLFTGSLLPKGSKL